MHALFYFCDTTLENLNIMKYVLTFAACLTITLAQAQIFGRIANRAKDKLVNRLEDKVVEKISDEIARAAMKPIDNAIDDMLKERYEQDSINGKTDVDYGEFVNAFLKPVNLPDNYTFDITLKCETKDYDGDKTEMEMLLTKDGSAIGFVQFEDGKKMTMVFDTKNELMAIYDHEENKVQGMPSMLSMAGAIAGKYDEDTYEVSYEKTGKSKKIKGYECNEWAIDDEETTTKAMVAEDFPIAWKYSFAPFLQQMLPTTQRDEMPEGMVLKSESNTKAKNKKSKFEVKKIIESAMVMNNADYEQETYTTDN